MSRRARLLTVWLPADLSTQLKQLAARRGEAEAVIVRTALRALVARIVS